MSDEPRFMEPLELIGLVDKTVTVREVGLEGIAFETEDGAQIVIWPCFNCGGPEAHLNYGVTEDSDSTST